ncbi:MAG: hypothetical protein HQM15_03570 [Deltaproteobacteria bacterium]|nr:hypothetical protein [Deltaproteobacteria bacterium]
MRFLIFIFCLYVLFKMFRGNSGNKGPVKPRQGFRNSYAGPSAKQEAPLIDEMKKCPTCGTFNPTAIALRRGSEFFCDEKCLK